MSARSLNLLCALLLGSVSTSSGAEVRVLGTEPLQWRVGEDLSFQVLSGSGEERWQLFHDSGGETGDLGFFARLEVGDGHQLVLPNFRDTLNWQTVREPNLTVHSGTWTLENEVKALVAGVRLVVRSRTVHVSGEPRVHQTFEIRLETEIPTGARLSFFVGADPDFEDRDLEAGHFLKLKQGDAVLVRSEEDANRIFGVRPIQPTLSAFTVSPYEEVWDRIATGTLDSELCQDCDAGLAIQWIWHDPEPGAPLVLEMDWTVGEMSESQPPPEEISPLEVSGVDDLQAIQPEPMYRWLLQNGFEKARFFAPKRSEPLLVWADSMLLAWSGNRFLAVGEFEATDVVADLLPRAVEVVARSLGPDPTTWAGALVAAERWRAEPAPGTDSEAMVLGMRAGSTHVLVHAPGREPVVGTFEELASWQLAEPVERQAFLALLLADPNTDPEPWIGRAFLAAAGERFLVIDARLESWDLLAGKRRPLATVEPWRSVPLAVFSCLASDLQAAPAAQPDEPLPALRGFSLALADGGRASGLMTIGKHPRRSIYGLRDSETVCREPWQVMTDLEEIEPYLGDLWHASERAEDRELGLVVLTESQVGARAEHLFIWDSRQLWARAADAAVLEDWGPWRGVQPAVLRNRIFRDAVALRQRSTAGIRVIEQAPEVFDGDDVWALRWSSDPSASRTVYASAPGERQAEEGQEAADEILRFQVAEPEGTRQWPAPFVRELLTEIQDGAVTRHSWELRSRSDGGGVAVRHQQLFSWTAEGKWHRWSATLDRSGWDESFSSSLFRCLLEDGVTRQQRGSWGELEDPLRYAGLAATEVPTLVVRWADDPESAVLLSWRQESCAPPVEIRGLDEVWFGSQVVSDLLDLAEQQDVDRVELFDNDRGDDEPYFFTFLPAIQAEAGERLFARDVRGGGFRELGHLTRVEGITSAFLDALLDWLLERDMASAQWSNLLTEHHALIGGSAPVQGIFARLGDASEFLAVSRLAEELRGPYRIALETDGSAALLGKIALANHGPEVFGLLRHVDFVDASWLFVLDDNEGLHGARGDDELEPWGPTDGASRRLLRELLSHALQRQGPIEIVQARYDMDGPSEMETLAIFDAEDPSLGWLFSAEQGVVRQSVAVRRLAQLLDEPSVLRTLTRIPAANQEPLEAWIIEGAGRQQRIVAAPEGNGRMALWAWNGSDFAPRARGLHALRGPLEQVIHAVARELMPPGSPAGIAGPSLQLASADLQMLAVSWPSAADDRVFLVDAHGPVESFFVDGLSSLATAGSIATAEGPLGRAMATYRRRTPGPVRLRLWSAGTPVRRFFEDVDKDAFFAVEADQPIRWGPALPLVEEVIRRAALEKAIELSPQADGAVWSATWRVDNVDATGRQALLVDFLDGSEPWAFLSKPSMAVPLVAEQRRLIASDDRLAAFVLSRVAAGQDVDLMRHPAVDPLFLHVAETLLLWHHGAPRPLGPMASEVFADAKRDQGDAMSFLTRFFAEGVPLLLKDPEARILEVTRNGFLIVYAGSSRFAFLDSELEHLRGDLGRLTAAMAQGLLELERRSLEIPAVCRDWVRRPMRGAGTVAFDAEAEACLRTIVGKSLRGEVVFQGYRRWRVWLEQ